jgi:hypothetical protein
MVFSTTFNNISDIAWRSVLLMVGTGGPVETTNLPQVTNELYHIILHWVHIAISEIRTDNFSGDNHWLHM